MGTLSIHSVYICVYLINTSQDQTSSSLQREKKCGSVALHSFSICTGESQRVIVFVERFSCSFLKTTLQTRLYARLRLFLSSISISISPSSQPWPQPITPFAQILFRSLTSQLYISKLIRPFQHTSSSPSSPPLNHERRSHHSRQQQDRAG